MADEDELYEIRTLVDGTGDIRGQIKRLAPRAQAKGLEQAELSLVFEMIFDSRISSTQKEIIIQDIMFPMPDYNLPPEYISQILSSIGMPEVYYKKGKQHKLKRLAPSVQVSLLTWMIQILPHFGTGSFDQLRRSLPILFGLLTFEYLRPCIAFLIILSTIAVDTKTHRKNVFKPWHMQFAIDLHLRFPQDNSLKILIRIILKSTPELLNLIPKANQSAINSIRSDPFPFVNDDFSKKYRQILRGSNLNNDAYVLDTFISEVKRDILSDKRRKIANTRLPKNGFFDTIRGSDKNLSNSFLDSLSKMVEHFENIHMMYPTSVFSILSSSSERTKSVYIALMLSVSSSSHPYYKKLRAALEYHVFDLNEQLPAYSFSQFLKFSKYGIGIYFKDTIQDFVLRKVNGNDPLKLFSTQCQVMCLVTHNSPKFQLCLESLMVNLRSIMLHYRSHMDSAVASFMELVEKLLAQNSADVSNNIALFEIVKSLTDFCFHAMSEGLEEYLLSTLTAFMSTVGRLKTVPWTKSEHNLNFLLPPPALTYKLLVSQSPILVSEICGYLAFLKNIAGEFFDEATLEQRNSYVMDALNFLWRDLAFKKEMNTFNNGMLLHDAYLQQLSGLNYFSYLDLIQLKSVGGLLLNPAFTYLSAELVWRMEDAHLDIGVRHPGPISESSITNIQKESAGAWLPMDYHQVRTSILNSLDEAGLSGICDLLFTSLKALANQRSKSSQSTEST